MRLLPRNPMSKLYDEWCNRPAHLMVLSYAEYVADREGKQHHPATASIPKEIKPSASRPRHEPEVMNGLEKKYAAYLEIRRLTGEIAEWRFEPLKLRLAPKTYYSPDFLVLTPEGRIELHECKGYMEDDASVKIKVAREMFGTLFTIVLVQFNKSKQWTFK